MAEKGSIGANSTDLYGHLYQKGRNEQTLAGEHRFNDLINHAGRFGNASLVHKVEVSDGFASSL